MSYKQTCRSIYVLKQYASICSRNNYIYDYTPKYVKEKLETLIDKPLPNELRGDFFEPSDKKMYFSL